MLPDPGAKFWFRDVRRLSTGLNFSPVAAVLFATQFLLAGLAIPKFRKLIGVVDRPFPITEPVGVPMRGMLLNSAFKLWCDASRSVRSLLSPSSPFAGGDLNVFSFFAEFFHFVTAGTREHAIGACRA